jgi:NAD(P)-dependent dehydrogenase (short-subunit alcohol dehydrogenase family)
MTEFGGKVALVTGGGTGIGRAAAVAFAREGAKVVVASRRADACERTVRLVKEAGGDGLFVRADVSRAEDVRAMVDRTVEAYGRLDFAFNNAGVTDIPAAFTEKTEDHYDRIMDVNAKGVWLCLKYEIAQMLKDGGGAIVNNSSVGGVVGMAGVAIYVASKHAVIGLTKSAALEFARSGVRINAVAPGAVETDMFASFARDPQVKERVMAMHPIGRVGQPEEVAAAVVWLCSTQAGFVTGHTLAVDGGFTAQ